MMEHQSIHAMLPLAAAEALDPADMQRVEQHAAVCDVCRQELQSWGFYARGVAELPPVNAPLGLLERTRARIVEQRELAAARRRTAILLAGLVVFLWSMSVATWMLARILAGGALQVNGVNLLNGMVWSVLSTALVWMTAVAAAAMLGKNSELARTL